MGHSTQGRGWLSELARQLAAAHTVRQLRLHLPEPYDNVHPALPSPYVDHQVSEECKDRRQAYPRTSPNSVGICARLAS